MSKAEDRSLTHAEMVDSRSRRGCACLGRRTRLSGALCRRVRDRNICGLLFSTRPASRAAAQPIRRTERSNNNEKRKENLRALVGRLRDAAIARRSCVNFIPSVATDEASKTARPCGHENADLTAAALRTACAVVGEDGNRLAHFLLRQVTEQPRCRIRTVEFRRDLAMVTVCDDSDVIYAASSENAI